MLQLQLQIILIDVQSRGFKISFVTNIIQYDTDKAVEIAFNKHEFEPGLSILISIVKWHKETRTEKQSLTLRVQKSQL